VLQLKKMTAGYRHLLCYIATKQKEKGDGNIIVIIFFVVL